MSATPYTGPSVREMMDNHSLAKEIIARAAGPNSQRILDDNELGLLRRWVTASEPKEQILAEQEISDGKTVEESGSLVRYLMANSVAGRELVTEEEFGL